MAPAFFYLLPASCVMSGKSFSLVPGYQADSFSPDTLDELNRILRRFRVDEFRFTSSRRLAVSGLTPEEMTTLGNELQALSAPKKSGWITYIQSCPGKGLCKYGIRDAEELGCKIENIRLPQPLNAKVKVGIAGCSMCCTEPYVRDIGLIAENKGWKLLFGGNAGSKPRIGDVIAEGLDGDEAIELIRKCLLVYQENVVGKKRTARFVESFGVEKFLLKVRGK